MQPGAGLQQCMQTSGSFTQQLPTSAQKRSTLCPTSGLRPITPLPDLPLSPPACPSGSALLFFSRFFSGLSPGNPDLFLPACMNSTGLSVPTCSQGGYSEEIICHQSWRHSCQI